MGGWIGKSVATPLLKECEDETHTPEMGTWESSGTPKTSELNCKSQNTSLWGILYIIGKLLKCRCRKWPRMSHLDICSTSYGKKKGRESNSLFDSRPLKVGNRPDPSVCRESATHRWKALKEIYKFALDLIPLGRLSEKLWTCKVLGVQTGIVSGQITIRMYMPWSDAENTIWGKVVVSPKSRPWWVLWVQNCPWLILAPKVFQYVN